MQKAPKSIIHLLPNPSYCDSCASLNIRYTTNDVIYGRTFGDWPHCWFCDDCRASVGCHPKTSIPLGRMADRATKALRKSVHDVFDLLWTSGLMTRSRAYLWLSSELNIEHNACHIAWLAKDQLKLALQVSKQYYAEREHIIERRRAKRNDRNREQHIREKQRIKRRKRTGL